MDTVPTPNEMDIYLTTSQLRTGQLDVYLGEMDIEQICPTISGWHGGHHYLLKERKMCESGDEEEEEGELTQEADSRSPTSSSEVMVRH